jgi:choline-sulfatase
MTRNLVIILSDQHRRDALGCSGHPLVQTPALDRLAEGGTLFTRGQCNAPICVPSRASLATGLPIHAIPSWDNADPYHGQRTSFMHRAREGGYHTASIGKLHFRSSQDDNGFDEEIDPLHVVNGTGTFTNLIRDPVPRITAASDLLKNAGAGETSYTHYDAEVSRHAVDWLQSDRAQTPFLLFVSFVNPHPPYVAPAELFDHYINQDLPLQDALSSHPGLKGLRTYFDLDGTPLTRDQARAVAAAYFANVTLLDRNIAAVLSALEASGQGAATNVIYTSDHGDSLGSHGLYGKCNMFEDSLGVPMIAAGPDFAPATRSDTPTQLLDIYPTVVDLLALAPTKADTTRPGTSLKTLAAAAGQDRTIIAQQHCAGVTSGVFGVVTERWKYIHTADAPPLLFDLANDPDERVNLAPDPDFAGIASDLHMRLCAELDPMDVDRSCKASQARRLAAAGGAAAIMSGPIAAYSPAPGGRKP